LGADGWWLDTHLRSKSGQATLIDSKLIHPAGEWHWVALVYDGKKMTHYVNGVLEKEAALEFPPMSAGETSIGVRLNRVYWFKGCIEQVRFDPAALAPGALQK